ncbi:AraC family transcriptional regulator [Pseudogemmobacter humi]|uniref:Virulence regulon transcriptional activator VirF n=1 Tax=Pseudogemmobacter humi TaxID=2483812 RepID=A0A3P5WY72_9RHOB|nr:AraC family transcriptional regulator [Pseudogemmobacter humi]VDC19894.1 Virulence regulon transcriptional activator VirF [Pseudogemmobacter humi]
MNPRKVTPGFVEDALACMAAAGCDAAPALKAAGIVTPLDGPVSAEAYGRFWHLCALAMQDEFFGLGARPMRPGSFALMCHALLQARDLGAAMRRALRFLNVVLDHPQGRIVTRNGVAEITLDRTDGPHQAFACRTYWLILLGVCCWLAGRRIPLLQLDFACPVPAERQDYLQFFGVPVRFDQPQSRLVFDARHLSLKLLRSPRALEQFLREAPGNILIRYRQDGGTADRLRRRLAAQPPAGWPEIGTIAAELRLSQATLRRRLRAEGQSFAAIKADIRLRHSQRLLRETPLSLAEIAAELGYSEPGAFIRAFRGWTGQNPGAFRKAAT